MTDSDTGRYTTCLVWYDKTIDAVLWSPDPLTTEEWDELVAEADAEWRRIDEIVDAGNRDEVPDADLRAYEGSVVSLLLHRHPEIRHVSVAETEFF